ncbi:MAG: hypothetical protein ACI96N_002388 [Arenicella sp.]|jgi:hypothetical protein
MANTETKDTQLVVESVDDAKDARNARYAENAKNAEQSTCSNCKEQLNGPYCAQCGQNSESTIKYFWLVMLHLLDDIFSFDSRASRTLWPLIIRPGFLTNEYILGRRVHYVPPLRLYFFISIIFFITLKFFAISENTSIADFSNDKNAISLITNHISVLEQQQDLLLTQENQEPSEALILLKQEIAKYNLYKTDITIGSNILLKAVARELVGLEFRRIKSGQALEPSSQKQYTNLSQQLVRMRNGESVNILSIGSSLDGSLSLPFLSPEKNVILNDFVTQLEEKASKVLQGDSGPLLQEVISKLPQLMFVLLPLFAALLKIVNFFSKRLYMEHLTVALHSHSFVFIIILLLEIIEILQNQISINWQWLDTPVNVLSNCILAWIPIYLFIMQKRVYKQGYILTAIKYLMVGIAYTALISITAIIALVWGLTDL